jgi:RNA polymerase sigma-70 factor (ECF subfamily)
VGRSRFPHITDEELVQHALVGEIEAFDELVRRFRGAVTFVAEQIVGSREAAEDVVQEAFLLAFRALPQLRDRGKFPAWLCAIARHRARRVAAAAGWTQPADHRLLDRLLLARSEELAGAAMEAWLGREERALIRRLMVELPAVYRAVLYLRYFEEWPIRRIAGFLSVSVTTVQWRLHHGRNLMRRRLIRQREEESDERRSPRAGGDPADLPYASPDGGAGPGSEHDGEPGARRPACGAAVQPGGEAT